MKSIQMLPEGYLEIFRVNLQTDKKKALILNGAALVIMIAMAVPVHFYIPITELFSFSIETKLYFLRPLMLLLSVVLYMILHELIHGAAMKFYGTKKVSYGFTGLYAFAGSKDFYDKKSYIVIALAPIVLWGVVLAAINLFVPREWFWMVYFIQIMNVSGAAGDLYVTFKFLKMPKDILVQDSGIEMKVYSKEKQ